MSTQESESALDAIVQQTWKRVRTAREIDIFLNGRFAALDALSTVDDQDLDDVEYLAA